MAYVCGGKLGDLIHVLVVIHTRWLKGYGKGVLYLTHDPYYKGDTFSYGLERTYDDIKPLIEAQPYIERISILSDNDTIVPTDINLSIWRSYLPHKPYCTMNWMSLLESVYSITIANPYGPWICPSYDFDHRHITDIDVSNKVVIHRSLNRHNDEFPWEAIVKHNDCIFVTSNDKEYEAFPYKSYVSLIRIHTITELASIIGRCKFYVGNQSAPSALVWAMGKPALFELYHIDAAMYKSPYIMWFESTTSHTLDATKRWLRFEPPRNIMLEVSMGEVLDKLSILQIKSEHIEDAAKLKDVRAEIASILPRVESLLEDRCTKVLYDSLKDTNLRIWNLIDVAREKGTTDPVVMRENDARFRVKNKLNHYLNSGLKEQKNFGNMVWTCEMMPTDDFEARSRDIMREAVYYDKTVVRVPLSERYNKAREVFQHHVDIDVVLLEHAGSDI